MKYETSAGGVIFAQKENELFVLLLKDKTGHWTFPKGLVEKGEQLAAAAAREIQEETSVTQLALIAELSPVEYFYKWEGKLKKKTVHYFVFEGDRSDSPKPQHEEGIIAAEWVTLTKAKQILGYKKTNDTILEEALRVYIPSHNR